MAAALNFDHATKDFHPTLEGGRRRNPRLLKIRVENQYVTKMSKNFGWRC
ncbi:hypothetical protein QO004_006275 [Rhizobium mesoamericanum]|nr:hypothetical protein [Rhizobium mesoamericanum]